MRSTPIHNFPYAPAEDFGFVGIRGDTTYLQWKGHARVAVVGESEIQVEVQPGGDLITIALNVVGSCLGLILYQRGLLVLHGSSVSMRGRAALFLGASGAGKSTTAAALVRRGHTLVADDIVALRTEQLPPRVLAARTPLRLWSDTLDALHIASAGLPLVRDDITGGKRVFRIQSHAEISVPIRRIYVLRYGEDIAVLRADAADSILGVIAQSYILRTLVASNGLARQFQQVSSIARLVRHLERPRDLGSLEEVAEAVEDDMS